VSDFGGTAFGGSGQWAKVCFFVEKVRMAIWQ